VNFTVLRGKHKIDFSSFTMINVVEFHFVPSGKLRRLDESLVQSRVTVFPLPKKETFLAKCSNQNTGVVF